MAADEKAVLDVAERAVRALERVGLILGLIVAEQMGGALPDKAKRLRQCGFSNTEIAGVLGSTPNAIGVALHKGKAKKFRQT